MRRRGTVWLWLAALAATACLTAGCGQTASQAQSDVSWEDRTPTHSMKLQYAEQFSVDYYDDGSSLITIGGNDRYLIVPEAPSLPPGWMRMSPSCGSPWTTFIWLRPLPWTPSASWTSWTVSP